MSLIFKDGFAFKTSICEGKNGGILPMFGTCKAYYVCVDGQAVIGSCDEDMLFNPLSLHCEDAGKVDCIFDAKAVENKDDSDSESEEDDDDFDEAVSMPKPPPTTSKPPKQQRPQSQATGSSDTLCAGKKDGVKLTKKDSCQDYFVCKERKSHLRSCPTGQHFSRSRRVCMRAAVAKCSVAGQESSKSEGPAVLGGLCPEDQDNSLVAHQTDCSKFMLCSNMMFLVMDCPTGLHFSVASSRCDYPKIAQCQASERKVSKSNTKSKKKGRKLKVRHL
ncbi:hypothetical protein KR018_004101 [Drosophila ironensis]|nr:hypothetical protein KR018_004101 [Drosophila ironensis]